MFAAPNNTIVTTAAAGLVLPTPAQDYVLSKITPGMQAAIAYDGENYGIPFSAEGYAVFYNRAYISDDEIPKTYEDLVAWCADFEAANPGKYGFFMDMSGYYTITWATQTPDKRLFGEFGTDTTVTNLNNPEVVETFAWMVENLRPVYDIPSADILQATLQAQFLAGESAMFVTGLWDVSSIQDAGIDFGIATFPTLPGSDIIPEVFSTARTMYTSAFSENPNEANAFATFLISDEMQELRYELCGSAPSTDVQVDSPFINGFAEQMAYSYPTPAVPQMDHFWLAMDNASKVIWDSTLTGEELRAFIQEQLDIVNDAILNPPAA